MNIARPGEQYGSSGFGKKRNILPIMGKKIKLSKGSYVNEEGFIVNPEIPKKQRPSLQKQAVKGEPLADKKPEGKPIEDYRPETIGDMLTAMHETAAMSAARAKGDGVIVSVGGIRTIKIGEGVSDSSYRYFQIYDKDGRGYVVYQPGGSEIYYRDRDEFFKLTEEIGDNVPGRTIKSLEMQYKDPTKPLQGYNVKQREDCLFIIASIFSSLTGQSYAETKHSISEVTEKNCVIIKHNKLGTDGLVKNSLKFKEAKYGTDEENKFKQEVEDKQKQDNVVGCLDQQPQEENAKIVKTPSNDVNDAEQPKKPTLPNVHKKVQESAVVAYDDVKGVEWNGNDYIWEPGDYVFVRVWTNKDKRKKEFHVFRGQVTDAVDPVNEEDEQIVTVLIHGGTYVIDPSDIAPDMTIEVQRNRFADTSGALVDRAYNNGAGNHEGESKEEYLDHNKDRYLYGDIVFNGNRLTFAPVRINLNDITESKHDVRVVNENSDQPFMVSIDNLDVDVENWPWAVVVDSDAADEDKREEPLRKIRVNPIEFVNADAESDGPEGLVQCIMGDKETKMLKKHIKILS